MQPCSIEGCTRPLRARGWCATHYWRWQHHGDPNHRRTTRPVQWIKDHARDEQGDCLIWPFGCSEGYAEIRFRGKNTYASRVMCEEAHGQPPNGASALHSCGNGHLACVHPKHLYWGTQSQNMRDRVEHAISKNRRISPNSVLTAEEVTEIRRCYKDGASRKALAERFLVSVSAIDDIFSGRTWAWLEFLEPWRAA